MADTRRCPACGANTSLHALADMRSDPRDSRHGTVKGYNYGCRCRACAEAKSEYMRRRRPPLRLKGQVA